MKKYILIFVAYCLILDCAGQLAEGALAPDFTATDVSGNVWHLNEMLDQGKTVVLNVFGAWDSYAWDYLQSGELQSFYALYGPDGLDNVMVLSIEGEATNGIGQLSGPALLSGDPATQTYGDWLTGNPIPVIDDAPLASLLQVNFLPTLYVICPDGVVSNSAQISAESLYDVVFEGACPSITDGTDPAILNGYVSRVCGSTDVSISFSLKNLGTLPLTNAVIQAIGVAGVSTYEWSGNLESYQSDTLTMEGIQLTNDDPVAVVITTLNDNTTNDTIRVNSEVGLSTLRVQLELSLDNYPDEVSWEIRDNNDVILFSGGNFEVAYEYINQTIELPSVGCYSFYLRDSEGDGLHGSQWGGFDGSCYLRSLDESNNVTSVLYAYDGAYNFSSVLQTPSYERIEFEAGSALNISEEPAQFNSFVFPNPSTGVCFAGVRLGSGSLVSLQLMDATGRLINARQCGLLSPGLNIIGLETESITDGLYYMRIQTETLIETHPIIISR